MVAVGLPEKVRPVRLPILMFSVQVPDTRNPVLSGDEMRAKLSDVKAPGVAPEQSTITFWANARLAGKKSIKQTRVLGPAKCSFIDSLQIKFKNALSHRHRYAHKRHGGLCCTLKSVSKG